MTTNTTQSWNRLPDDMKRQAAADMLANGKPWFYFGRAVERPSDAELRRWLPAPEPAAYRSNADKREAVMAALRAAPKRASLRQIARLAGVSHTFAARLAKTSR